MINSVESPKNPQIIHNSFIEKFNMDTIKISYPAEFNKKDLTLAIEKARGTSFFYGSESNVNYTRLKAYVLSYPDLIEDPNFNKSCLDGRHKIKGPDAEAICKHLGLSSINF